MVSKNPICYTYHSLAGSKIECYLKNNGNVQNPNVTGPTWPRSIFTISISRYTEWMNKWRRNACVFVVIGYFELGKKCSIKEKTIYPALQSITFVFQDERSPPCNPDLRTGRHLPTSFGKCLETTQSRATNVQTKTRGNRPLVELLPRSSLGKRMHRKLWRTKNSHRWNGSKLRD